MEESGLKLKSIEFNFHATYRDLVKRRRGVISPGAGP